MNVTVILDAVIVLGVAMTRPLDRTVGCATAVEDTTAALGMLSALANVAAAVRVIKFAACGCEAAITPVPTDTEQVDSADS